MPAAERFVSLTDWLDGSAAERPAPPVPEPPPAENPATPPALPAELEAVQRALRDVRFFRARLADALAAATGTLIRDLAYAVLGRELRACPADVAAVARRILDEHPAAAPVIVRHAPGETFEAGVPAEADPTLAPGDVVIVFAEGEVDARLAVRFDVILEAWR